MARGFDRAELLRLAQIGARARLTELEAERASLLRAFPGLRRSFAPTAQPDGDTGDEQPKRRRRRRRMSPEARKRISEMMKKRWAERRRR
jgi:hypothetical protein